MFSKVMWLHNSQWGWLCLFIEDKIFCLGWLDRHRAIRWDGLGSSVSGKMVTSVWGIRSTGGVGVWSSCRIAVWCLLPFEKMGLNLRRQLRLRNMTLGVTLRDLLCEGRTLDSSCSLRSTQRQQNVEEESKASSQRGSKDTGLRLGGKGGDPQRRRRPVTVSTAPEASEVGSKFED